MKKLISPRTVPLPLAHSLRSPTSQNIPRILKPIPGSIDQLQADEIKLQIKDAEHELKTVEENIKNVTAQLEMEKIKRLQRQPQV